MALRVRSHECTRVLHTAKNCLISSTNNTLIEKHHDHKFSEPGLYFVLYSVPSM